MRPRALVRARAGRSRAHVRAINFRAINLRALACLALAQFVLFVGARAQVLYHNPVMAGDHPDPTVVRVGADYWALVTTGGWAPHFTIMRSPDLVNWRTVGAAFRQKPAWAKDDFWAPELVADGGRFYLYYTARRDDGAGKRGTLCVAVATAAQPQGPYADHGPLVCQEIGSIDAFSLRDETGRRYLIWKEDGNDRNQPTPIWAQALTDDGLKLTGKRRELIRNDAPWERHVVEGPYVLRHGGYYYLFYSGNACCGRACDYALGVARARKIFGPWEKNPRNPIVSANAAWQCPGHGDVVTTPDGREYLLYHAYRRDRDTFNTGREAVLDRIEWDARGWPTVNGGRGPATDAPAPLGRLEHAASSELFDGFNTAQLAPAWQWPMNNAPSVRVDAENGGYLTLAPQANAGADEWTGAVLAWRVPSGNYTATTLVDARSLQSGARAGLAAYGWRDAAVGIAAGDGRVYVWRREGDAHETLTTTQVPAAPALYLRMRATDGEAYDFSYSANGREWTRAGARVNASYIEGAHVALTAAGGAARFDWVRVEPRER